MQPWPVVNASGEDRSCGLRGCGTDELVVAAKSNDKGKIRLYKEETCENIQSQ
jgi:hypothetical protein